MVAGEITQLLDGGGIAIGEAVGEPVGDGVGNCVAVRSDRMSVLVIAQEFLELGPRLGLVRPLARRTIRFPSGV